MTDHENRPDPRELLQTQRERAAERRKLRIRRALERPDGLLNDTQRAQLAALLNEHTT